MALLYITEYDDMGYDNRGNPIPIAVEPGDDQIPLNFATVNTSESFAESTQFIAIYADADYHFVIGANPLATVNNKKRSAGVTEYYRVTAGHKLSAIAAV